MQCRPLLINQPVLQLSGSNELLALFRSVGSCFTVHLFCTFSLMIIVLNAVLNNNHGNLRSVIE